MPRQDPRRGGKREGGRGRGEEGEGKRERGRGRGEDGEGKRERERGRGESYVQCKE